MIGWIKRLFRRIKLRQSAPDYQFDAMTDREKLLAGYEILRRYGMWDVLKAELVRYSVSSPLSPLEEGPLLRPFEEGLSLRPFEEGLSLSPFEEEMAVKLKMFLRKHGISEPYREVGFESFLREHGISEADIVDLLRCGFLDNLAEIGKILDEVEFIANGRQFGFRYASDGLLALDERPWFGQFLDEVKAAEKNDARGGASSPIG